MNQEETKIDFREVVKEQKKEGRQRIKKALAEKKANRIKKIKRLTYIGIILLSALIIGVYWFAKNYYIQSPVTFKTRSMIVKIENKELSILSPMAYADEPEKPTLTDMQIIEQYRLKPFIKGIYMLESTFGQNDSCKEKGLFNGYGYRQNERENKCYDNFEKVTELVNDWLEERLTSNGNNIIEAVCYYNTGIANQSGCKYSDNFMSILVDNL